MNFDIQEIATTAHQLSADNLRLRDLDSVYAIFNNSIIKAINKPAGRL